MDEIVDIDRLEECLKWATKLPWSDEAGYNNAGCPTRFFNIPGHSSGGQVEMMAEDSSLLVAAVNSLPALIAEIRRLRAEVAK